MAKCGKCKEEGVTVEHVKACYSTPLTVVAQSSDYKPMALTTNIPNSRYALEVNGELKYYVVRTAKGGKWDGFRFVDRLVGHPGDFAKYPVKGDARKLILSRIGENPQEAAVLFSKTFTICAVCGSPLTDPESMERGLGPVCAERF